MVMAIVASNVHVRDKRVQNTDRPVLGSIVHSAPWGCCDTAIPDDSKARVDFLFQVIDCV